MFEQPQPNKEKDELLRLRNEMQIALAARFYGFKADDSVMKWIEKYSAPFRKLIAEEPALLLQFKENSSMALEEAEKKLYAPKEQQ